MKASELLKFICKKKTINASRGKTTYFICPVTKKYKKKQIIQFIETSEEKGFNESFKTYNKNESIVTNINSKFVLY